MELLRNAAKSGFDIAQAKELSDGTYLYTPSYNEASRGAVRRMLPNREAAITELERLGKYRIYYSW